MEVGVNRRRSAPTSPPIRLKTKKPATLISPMLAILRR